jgi:SAM-dependent methyltransferase
VTGSIVGGDTLATMSDAPPDPTPITRHLDGALLHGALIAALELRLCGHLEHGPATVDELAARAAVSPRGAQVLLDALVALGIVEVEGGRYRNGAAAAAYLVPGRPAYLGDEQVGLFHSQLPLWDRLAELARAGVPAHRDDSAERIAFWRLLTPSIGRIGRPVAERALRLLELDRGAPWLLDVGGGAAALYSMALFALNRHARATQLDWPHVNEMARAKVREAGFAARFHTVDGDYRSVPIYDIGEQRHDVAVLSYIVHLEPRDSVLALLEKVRAALKPGGRLLISEFVVDDGRAGPPRALLFNLNMLVHSEGGKSYERSELERLVIEAGFTDIRFTAAPPFTTLIDARRPS